MVELDREVLLGFYRTMVTIREFETEVAALFAAGRIPGFVHLYVGEEAVATGVCAHLTPQDKIASTHRGHGHLIAKGGNLKRMMAELFGRKTGYCKGKGGSMHVIDLSIGILGANGIVGASLPIATGAGIACAAQEHGAVSVCFFGDGAAARGTFHESVNLAAIWKLPVVYVCENNLYAVSCYLRNALPIANIAERAAGYGIPGVSIDGNDVLAVYQASGEAINRARKGDGPSLIVANTWRQRGHFEGEPEIYRDQQEIQEWLQRDPIKKLTEQLLKRGDVDAATLHSIDTEVKIQIQQAVEFAETSPEPSPDELFEDVYTQ